MRRISLIVFLVVLAFAGLSSAQTEAGQRKVIVTAPGGPGMPPPPPPAPLGKWWKNSDVVKELQLSDAQIKQIEQTFLDYRMRLIDLKADVERQELKLQPLIEADRPDEQQVGTQVDAVLAARAKLEKTNTMMMLAIRKALSVEQWKKLQAIQQKREGPFFTHFDGPLPPGAHMDRDVIYLRHGPDGPESMPAPPPRGPGLNE
jgi:Spy/CpxP family protein refolding chaperone